MATITIPSLPYIDETPSHEQVKAAETLIAAETGPLNTSIPESKKSLLSAAMEEYVSDRKRPKGIDISRYSNLEDTEGNIDLKTAYTALEYTLGRRDAVAALSDYGRVQWLVGNDELDRELKIVDQRLLTAKRTLETVNVSRKRRQNDVADTLQYLEKRWKGLLGDLVDVGVKNALLEAQLESDEEGEEEEEEEGDNE
ncbi:Pre-mRNA-splicing factor SPF27 [Yarrowia lipolytica]|uniref:Pre-mRNA-splicing factor SPF27 n=1 Tax=Yarrowia lipolytica TaxID=4952 RepID=A0A1D8NBF0_YARLL|nr:hypothetical protein YALI1_C23040g [Yarrowia lipolytica]KAB8283712.1 Pre-mRNA-splicing factor SPF27 [Yarrowia lipolytica]KAE8172193.1 Pre-mRNA-splicing factor SPF27 [Yarrowia lipolytica]KAJ8053508.1 Pre-mRNA-splicing factor SPF27 [Yarrowia lipolytica]RMI94761.1 Pre-mRNA-splicing factor SPF27 [Yarrowia lipolytica]